MEVVNRNEYRRASHERLQGAADAQLSGQYVNAHYLAGLSVECMLRAYRWATDPSWYGRHDLRELLKASKVYVYLPASIHEILGQSFNEVVRRWSNNHRYYPGSKLESYLKEIQLGGKEALKKNGEVMIQCAQVIVGECDKKCP